MKIEIPEKAQMLVADQVAKKLGMPIGLSDVRIVIDLANEVINNPQLAIETSFKCGGLMTLPYYLAYKRAGRDIERLKQNLKGTENEKPSSVKDIFNKGLDYAKDEFKNTVADVSDVAKTNLNVIQHAVVKPKFWIALVKVICTSGADIPADVSLCMCMADAMKNEIMDRAKEAGEEQQAAESILSENTKITLTVKQIKELVRESALVHEEVWEPWYNISEDEARSLVDQARMETTHNDEYRRFGDEDEDDEDELTVKESYADDVTKQTYDMWVAFINKFGAETAAKLLAYKNISGKWGIDVQDLVDKYSENYSDEEVIYALREKASSLGLSDDSVDTYNCYVYSKFDKFFYDKTGDSDYLKAAYEYDVIEDLDKALSNKECAYLVVFEGFEEQYRDDTLMWDDAKEALQAKFNVITEGTTRDNLQYMVLTDK